MIERTLDQLTPFEKLILIALFASFYASIRLLPGASWYERLINTMGGVVFAAIFAPAMADWLNAGPNGLAATGFICGLCGVLLMQGVTDLLRAVLAGLTGMPWGEVFREVITKWLTTLPDALAERLKRGKK